MRWHFVDRRTRDHDELGPAVIEPAKSPVDLVAIIAVDEHQLLTDRHEIQRIHALARARDHIALIVENILVDLHCGVEDPAPLAHGQCNAGDRSRSEEHTSELQSLLRISYTVFCL